MKKIIMFIFLIVSILQMPFAQKFSFAFFTDLHIQSENKQPDFDLTKAVNEVNSDTTISFVLVGGDITNSGDAISMRTAKRILDNLKVPYYITPGNHDTMLNDSGLVNFMEIFGPVHFNFFFKNYRFIGINSGPPKNSKYGHISEFELNWLKNSMSSINDSMPLFIITHYPLQTGDVDNWQELTAFLRKFNIQAVLNGHYHRNAVLNYDGLPGIVNRSTLSNDLSTGGYTIFVVTDKLQVFEKRYGSSPYNWLNLPLGFRLFDELQK